MFTNLSVVDLFIIAASMLGMIALGVWFGRRSSDAREYMLGGGHVPWWAVLGSIVATETSTATFLSVPGIAYAQGGDFRFLQLAFGYILGRILVSVLLLPHYFSGQLFSAYELLQRRFGRGAQRLASLLFLVARNLGDGLRLFLAGLALEKVLAIDLSVCILLIGAATIAYTYFGGIKAVVWADCIQFVIYIAGGAIALYSLVDRLPDGWTTLSSFAEQTGRWRVFDLEWTAADGQTPLTRSYTIWSGVIGGAVLSLGTHGVDQMMVQRSLCAGNLRAATKALVLSGFVVLAQFAFFLLIGVALACFYSQVEVRSFEHNDEVFAAFIVDHLPVGVVGLTLAAVFSAAMSTLSSSLNSSATAVASDFFVAAEDAEKGQAKADRRLLRLTRAWTIVFGVVQIAVGIGASRVSQSVVGDALAIAGFTAGVLLGVFLLAILTERANEFGAVIGMIAGILVLLWVKFSTDVAWPWYAVIGSVITCTVGYVASLAGAEAIQDEKP